MEQTILVLLILSGSAVVCAGGFLIGWKACRSRVHTIETLSALIDRQGQQLIESHRRAMNMASIVPEQQLDRINAEMIAEAARTGESPIDRRREQEGSESRPRDYYQESV